MLLLVIMYIKKTLQKIKTDEILKAYVNYLFLQTNVVNWGSVLPLHLEENGCLTTR